MAGQTLDLKKLGAGYFWGHDCESPEQAEQQALALHKMIPHGTSWLVDEDGDLTQDVPYRFRN